MPKISVALASYNGAQYISQQMDSILESIANVPDLLYEVVVSYDGSTDETVDIVSGYITKGYEISVIAGPQKGIIANFENAMEHCTGDIVFLSDQDDVWLKPKVATVVEVFKKDPALTCVIHNVEIVNGDLTDTGQTFYEIRNSKKGFINNLIKNRFMGSAMAIKRDTLKKVLPIPKNIPMHDQWIGMINEIYGKTAFIDDVLGLYRRHGSNASSYEDHGNIRYMLSTRYTLIKDLLSRSKESR